MFGVWTLSSLLIKNNLKIQISICTNAKNKEYVINVIISHKELNLLSKMKYEMNMLIKLYRKKKEQIFVLSKYKNK
jgi:hypothetical protein